jgi:hypothetical protein
MKIFMATALMMISFSTLVHADEVQPQCVDREVSIVLKSDRNVHYSEKDEGRVVGTVKIRDCGDTLIIDQNSKIPAPSAARVCPPGMQDCVRP